MVTMKDIAKIAGVSIATVSRVIAGNASVSEETKQKVLSTIEELGYCSNELARGLRQKQTNLIAVIVPSITNPFYADVLKGIDDVLYISGFVPLFHDSDNDEENEGKTLAYMRSLGIAGALVAPCKGEHKDLSQILTSEIPYVCITKANEKNSTCFDAILHDYELAGYTAAVHLIESGRKNIVYLTENCDQEPCKEIGNGYEKAVKEHGLENRTFAVGSGAMRVQSNLNKVLQPESGGPPDGIIVESDLLASEVMRYLIQSGINVPSDTSLISFGNTLIAKSTNPMLTSIGPSGYQIGMMGAQRLIKRVKEDDVPEGILKIEPKLIVRGS